MKNANGYGSVTKLSGKRRRPYMVRVTEKYTVDYDTGKLAEHRKVLGYYATQAEARQALADYHNNPMIFQQDATFAEVYEKWSSKKYETLSASAVRAYKAAFKNSNQLYSMKMRDVQAIALQRTLDTGGHSYEVKSNMAQLWRAMFTFAIANQLVQTGLNPADYLDLGKKEKKKKPHQRFSRDELTALVEHADDPNVQVVLLLIYTGLRPGELVDLRKENVHLDERWIYIDHGKTANAVRPVPLHPLVVPFVERLMKEQGENLVTKADGSDYSFSFEYNRQLFSRQVWEPALRKAGVLEYEPGKNHRPHDARHTFASLWKGQKLDEAIRRKIQGHSGQGIGEQVYMLPDHDDLIAEMDQLWSPKVLPTCYQPVATGSHSEPQKQRSYAKNHMAG